LATLRARKRTPDEARATLEILAQRHPGAHCELDHANAFQLLVATVLSAQTTDVAVNKLTPGLFSAYPSAQTLARADTKKVEGLIDRIGMFRQKSKNIVGLAKALVETHGGQVPRTMAELVKLPGVGRKTANVVLGVIWGAPDGVVVDTHVQRLSQRLGWTKKTEPVEIELELNKLLPRADWYRASHILIFHGRRVCDAERPNCDECPLAKVDEGVRCPSAFAATTIGRKPKPKKPRPRRVGHPAD